MLRFIATSLTALFCLQGASANNTAIEPVPRLKHVWKNRGGETWIGRHEAARRQASKGEAELIFVGDSITHSWTQDGLGKNIWEDTFGTYKPLNLGFGGDQTGHVLWRLENGEIDGIQPKLAVVMIGTNNWRSNTPEEIYEGVEAVCAKIHEKLPETKILLLAIFPRADFKRGRHPNLITSAANKLLPKLDDKDYIHFLDINPSFLSPDESLSKEIMPDLLHPSKKGYQIWADAIAPHVKRLMNLKD